MPDFSWCLFHVNVLIHWSTPRDYLGNVDSWFVKTICKTMGLVNWPVPYFLMTMISPNDPLQKPRIYQLTAYIIMLKAPRNHMNNKFWSLLTIVQLCQETMAFFRENHLREPGEPWWKIYHLNPFMDCVPILNRVVFLPDFPRPRHCFLLVCFS